MGLSSSFDRSFLLPGNAYPVFGDGVPTNPATEVSDSRSGNFSAMPSRLNGLGLHVPPCFGTSARADRRYRGLMSASGSHAALLRDIFTCKDRYYSPNIQEYPSFFKED